MSTPRHIQKASQPIAIKLPTWGAIYAESIHDPNFQSSWRRDPFHKLIYLLKGAVSYESGKEKNLLSEGAFMGISNGTHHCLTDQITPTILLLCFSEEFLKTNSGGKQLWGKITNYPQGLHPYPSMNRQIENLWRQSILEQKALQIGHSSMITANTLQILTLLSRLSSNKFPVTALERVKVLLKKIEETFYEEWNIDRACKEADLSRRHFCSLFQQTTRMTFLEKLTEIRLLHAANLLKEGRSSISGTAFSCGFQDLSHFYRLFTRKYGQPPKQWLSKNLKEY